MRRIKKKRRWRRKIGGGWIKKVLLPVRKQKTNAKAKSLAKKSIEVKRQISFDEEDDEDHGEECFYCNEAYSKPKDNDGWIRC